MKKLKQQHDDLSNQINSTLNELEDLKDKTDKTSNN